MARYGWVGWVLSLIAGECGDEEHRTGECKEDTASIYCAVRRVSVLFVLMRIVQFSGESRASFFSYGNLAFTIGFVSKSTQMMRISTSVEYRWVHVI